MMSTHTASPGHDVLHIGYEPPLYAVQWGAERRHERPEIVLVHGLGGSHANWMLLGPLLGSRARVVALDLPGFGLSVPDGVSSVETHLQALERFVRMACRGPVLLVGNSMGGALSMMLAARAPELVAGLVLLNPALPFTLKGPHDPGVLARFMTMAMPFAAPFTAWRTGRITPEASVREMLELTMVEPDALPRDVFDAHVALAGVRRGYHWTEAAMVDATRSLIAALVRRPQFEAMMRRIKAPTTLVHGAADRLVPISAAHAASQLCPHWSLEVLEGVAHVPQLELPERVVEIVERLRHRAMT